MADNREMTLRFRWLLVALALWVAVAFFRAYYLAVPGRDFYLGVGERLARIEPAIPAARGRLLDRDGVPLAWSERYFDLWSTADEAPMEESLRKRLAEILPERAASLNFRPGAAVLRHLDAAELLALEPLLREESGLRIRSRVERIVAAVPGLRDRVGAVTVGSGGAVTGVSGWELEYDRELRGSPGRFSVMLDRYRRWIPSSWRLLSKATPGRDVTVPFRLADGEGVRK